LRRFFALSAAVALNIRLRVCLTVATPFDRMVCKVKSWLSQLSGYPFFPQSDSYKRGRFVKAPASPTGAAFLALSKIIEDIFWDYL